MEDWAGRGSYSDWDRIVKDKPITQSVHGNNMDVDANTEGSRNKPSAARSGTQDFQEDKDISDASQNPNSSTTESDYEGIQKDEATAESFEDAMHQVVLSAELDLD